MTHLIARHPDGYHVPLDHPEAVVEQISGELRKVTMWNDGERDGHLHAAVDYVPVEHLDEYVARALSNAHRDTASGDRAWDHVEVGDEHEDGPGGPNQFWDGKGDDAMPFTPSDDPRGGAVMSLTATMKVTIANAYIAVATWLALVTTTPGSSTGTEVSGGSPAYARVAAAWGTPNGTTGVTTGTPAAINVPASTTIVGVEYFNASTAGTYEDGATVTSQTFASQGTYTVSPTLTPS